MSELYGFILLHIRGIGLLAGLFLLDQYQHEAAYCILKKIFSLDDIRQISSGVLNFTPNGIRERVLVRDINCPPKNRSVAKAMRVTLEFFQTVTPEAIAIIKKQLSGEEHVSHLNEMVYLI